ncbi:MAG TPA: hypothetical protein VJQ57_13785 [Acidimicrobiia bacterium]|nr:hypothetical protein [Acidimicrobiia bacterium]
MARVSVVVNVRDLTRAELQRMRHNFRTLGEDLSNAVGARNRQNFERLSQSVNVARRDLTRLRGAIPEAEFLRLDDAIRRSQRTLQRGFSNVGANAFNRVARQVQEVVDGFRDLDRDGSIQIRVDTSALDRADAQLARWRTEQARAVVRQRVDVDTNRAESRIRRWAMGPLRGLGGLIGGTLSDGIGQGLVGAFRSPTFGALVVAALVAAMSFVGAALAGVLVLAIGGAFAGLGGFIAAKSKEVSGAWERELERLKPLFKEAAEPMIPVLVRAIGILGKMGEEFAPKFRDSLEKAAPFIDDFIDRTREGFRRMGQNAWDDLQKSFRIFLDAFGPQWEDFLAEFGSSLGALARTVSEHSTEIAAALRGILGIINILIDTINFFANAWALAFRLNQEMIAGFLGFMSFFVDSVLGYFQIMLDGAVSAFSWIPGLGGKLEEAQGKFSEFRGQVTGEFQRLADRASQWGVEMDQANRKRVLEIEISGWMNDIERAKEEMKSVPPSRQAELKAKIDDLMGKVSAAKQQLASIQPNYYVRIHAYKTGDWALGLGGPQAHGGVTGNWGRAATGGARSNMTLVGEHGPELVDLAPGSHVRSNPDSRRMLAQSTGQQGATTLILKSDGSRMSDVLLELLRDAIHDAGGDPVKVLGG